MKILELKNTKTKMKTQMSLMIHQIQLKSVNRNISYKKIATVEHEKNKNKEYRKQCRDSSKKMSKVLFTFKERKEADIIFKENMGFF